MNKKYTLPKPLRYVLEDMRLRLLDGQDEDLVEFWKRETNDGQLPYGYEIRDALRPQLSSKLYRALVDNDRPAEFNDLTDDELNAVLHDILRTTLPQHKLAEKHGWIERYSEQGMDEGRRYACRLMRAAFDYFRQRWLSLDGFEYFGNEVQALVFDEKINHRKAPKQIHLKHGFNYALINRALRELEKKLRR